MDVANAMTFEERIKRALLDNDREVIVIHDDDPSVMRKNIVRAFGLDGLDESMVEAALNGLVKSGGVHREYVNDDAQAVNSNIQSAGGVKSLSYALNR